MQVLLSMLTYFSDSFLHSVRYLLKNAFMLLSHSLIFIMLSSFKARA